MKKKSSLREVIILMEELLYRMFRVVGYSMNPTIRQMHEIPDGVVFEAPKDYENYTRETQEFFDKMGELNTKIKEI